MRTVTMIVFLMLLATVGGAQQTYYVSTRGSNANPGTSSLPWQTVQYGLNQLTAGDTLRVMAGVYNEKVRVDVSGTPDNVVTVRSHGDGEVVLDGSGITATEAIVAIYSRSHVVLDGFTVANNQMADAQGILVTGSGTDITIRNNTIHTINFSANPGDPVSSSTNAQPLIVLGTGMNQENAITNLVIQGNEIYDCRTGYSEGLAVNGNVDGFEIVGNHVHDIPNIGIDVIGHEGTSPDPSKDQARNGVVRGNTVSNCISPYATSAGIYVDGGKDVVIERNVSFHNGYGIEVGCENVGKSASGITVRDNLIYDNEISGIALGGYDYPGVSGKVVDARVSHNTLFRNDFEGSGTGELALTYTETSRIDDNVFVTSSQNLVIAAEVSSVGLLLDYNLYYCPGGAAALEFGWPGSTYLGLPAFQAGTGLDAHSGFDDPKFVAATIPLPDLHLTAGSPAIGAGDPAFVPASGEKDIDGQNRVSGGRVDVGADEHAPPRRLRPVRRS